MPKRNDDPDGTATRPAEHPGKTARRQDYNGRDGNPDGSDTPKPADPPKR